MPVVPEKHAEAVLAAAAFLDEYDMAPVDALHAGIATTGEGRICSTDGVFDEIGPDRMPLEPGE